jgi:hypothetical protein
MACMYVLMNSHFTENLSTGSCLTPSFHDVGVTVTSGYDDYEETVSTNL